MAKVLRVPRRFAERKLVIASHNKGKLKEMVELMAPLGIEVVLASDLGLPEPDETEDTYLGNAKLKAAAAAKASGLPALADDSGLSVDALGGAPGVHSAYYAGREGDREARDARNNAKLLASLKDERRAHYTCVIVLLENSQKNPLVAEGLWHGEIARAPRGANGFGYDPLFFLKELNQTAAELDPALKNRISHRGIALARLLELLREPSHP
jgi:XTP/dITP diphosphohydrolase